MKKIIFTDLDGTLLDHNTYSYAKANQALNIIRKKTIPLIICTSKTRAEIEAYRKELGNKHPFISENGGAIFIPKKYFSFKFKYNKEDRHYFIIQLGASYKRLNVVIQAIEKTYEVKSFSDMSTKELAKETGLSLKQAGLAKKREFDKAFMILNPKHEKAVLSQIKKSRLHYTIGGRYYHIMGKSDKGKAVEILTRLFKKEYEDVMTIGLGDSPNDFHMLDNVDAGYLVMKKNRRYSSKKYARAKGIGPEGWNKAVKKEVQND